MKKVNTMGIVGKVFNCRIQSLESFCDQRSLEVTRGQQLISDRETIKKCGLAICVNRFLRKIEKTRILKRQINRIKKKNKEKNK